MTIKLYNTLKNMRPAGIWKICCWIHILAWNYCSSFVFHKSLVFNGSLQYVQCAPYTEIQQIFLLFSMIWYCRVHSPAVYKRQDVRWCNCRWSIPLSIDYVLESSMDGVISTTSCSYCTSHRYCKIISSFCQILYCLFDYIRLNSINSRVQTTRCTML